MEGGHRRREGVKKPLGRPIGDKTPDWAKQDEKDNAYAAGNAELPEPKLRPPLRSFRCDECGLLKGHDAKCSKANIDTRTIDWVKECETKPKEGVRIKMTDGSYAPELGDEIQGREREVGEEG